MKTTLSLLLAALLLLAMMPMPAFSQDSRGEDATAADGLELESDRARQSMIELEQRMFRLAELLKETQPEDANRLSLTFDRSREELLTQRMETVGDLLGTLELTEASANVEEIIAELQSIKKMLLTQDLDVMVATDKLKAMDAAIEAIDEILAAEEANQAAANAMAQGSPSAQALAGAAEAEDANKEDTEEVQGDVGEIDPDIPELGEAAEALAAAAAAMGEASESLSGQPGQPGQPGEPGDPGEASESQQEAIEQLREARAAIEQAKKDLQEEIERKVREIVMDNLQAMLDLQVSIRQHLERVAEAADSGDARAIVQVRGLAAEEGKIVLLANETIELAEQTEFSITLPGALSAVRDRMQFLIDDYAAGYAGPTVVGATVQVEQDLRDLIQAMEQSNSSQEPQEPTDGTPADPNADQQRELNQMIAELKMLRLMQMATNDNLGHLDEVKDRGDLTPAETRRRELGLRDRENRIREATQLLGERAAGQ